MGAFFCGGGKGRRLNIRLNTLWLGTSYGMNKAVEEPVKDIYYRT
jgi:hypothetical protein